MRIISATHRNLEAMIEEGSVFERTCIIGCPLFRLELPPLRERVDDTPQLVQHFFTKVKQKYGRMISSCQFHLMPGTSVTTAGPATSVSWKMSSNAWSY